MGLKNLEGVKEVEPKWAFFHNLSELNKILKDNICVTAAGDDGAINIYKQDNGFYRCQYMRYQVTYENVEYKFKKDALAFASKYLSIIRI